jgi:LmbE family N-acetylglucosaminyl deacetylase
MAEDQQVQRKVAMAFMAHPDDMEFGSAGTVAKWVRPPRAPTSPPRVS